MIYELERCGIRVLVLRTKQPRRPNRLPSDVAAWAPEWAVILYDALEPYAACSRPTRPVHGMSMQRYFALVAERPSLEKAIMAVWRLGGLQAVQAFMMREAMGLPMGTLRGFYDG